MSLKRYELKDGDLFYYLNEHGAPRSGQLMWIRVVGQSQPYGSIISTNPELDQPVERVGNTLNSDYLPRNEWGEVGY